MINAVKKHPFVTVFFLLCFLSLLVAVYTIRSLSGGGIAIPSGDKIAIIEIDGVIIDSKETLEEIEGVSKNDKVKGVVIRINSPGGGVAPSQEIYSELRKLSSIKPVVASLSSVAASGGYYIASAANKIVANSGTLIGSIGVIMDFSNVQGLFEKVGLKNNVIKSGKYKDIGSPHRDMTLDERRLLQSVIDNVHGQFISAIVDGRKLDRELVEKVADGRVFSGEQALVMKLVDSLGTINDAIEITATMASIEGEPKVYYTKKDKSLIDFILENTYAGAIYERISMPQFMFLATF